MLQFSWALDFNRGGSANQVSDTAVGGREGEREGEERGRGGEGGGVKERHWLSLSCLLLSAACVCVVPLYHLPYPSPQIRDELDQAYPSQDTSGMEQEDRDFTPHFDPEQGSDDSDGSMDS